MKNNSSIFIMRLIFIFISINYSFLDCCNNIAEPILLSKNNTCVLKYCTEEDYEKNICKKDNNIIRTQWLSSIIQFGDVNCRFPKIGNYSNGDIVAICQLDPEQSYISYFYGLKENGRPLFIKDDKETSYNPLNNYIFSESVNITQTNYSVGELLVIKSESDNEEYLLNIGRYIDFIELYNFDNKIINREQNLYVLSNFLSNEEVRGIRNSLFSMVDSNYFLYAGIFCQVQCTSPYLKLYKLQLNKDESKILIIKSSDDITLYGNMASCFETKNGAHILCFYIHSLNDKQYKIIMFDKELKKKNNDLTISSDIINENIFFKCIYYEEERGVFVYYDEGPYPIILFRQKKVEEIKEWDGLDKVNINSYIFNTDLNLNDIIKLENDVICFSSISTDKEILYIIMLTIFDNKSKVKIRYYILRTFGLYQYKFYLDLRLYIYNQFIALTSSYCNQKECENGNTHNSSLIIFSYPNSTDFSKDIVDVLIEKNIFLENLIFNLSLRNIVSIENNIFGLIYNKIIIKTIENCDKINLNSSKNNSEITNDYQLENDEDIKVTFNNYNLFNCIIGYIYEATEPEYITFEKYAEKKIVKMEMIMKKFLISKKKYILEDYHIIIYI